MTLDPQLAVLREHASAPASGLGEMRERIVAGNVFCSGGSQAVSVSDSEIDGVPCRTYTSGAPQAVLVYAHGGGWVTGDLDYADEVCREIAAQGKVEVVSVEYALAPEHTFPQAWEDVTAVAAALREHHRLVVLAGDSAGGNLAAVAANRIRPDALVLIYPALDATMQTESYDDPACAFPIGRDQMAWFYEQYAPAVSAENDDLSPGRAPLSAAHPPTLIVTAGHDPLRDEGIAHAHRLKAAGVSVQHLHFDELCHGFLRFTGLSDAAITAREAIVTEVDALVASLTA